jgi:hypothetical protein
MSEEVSELFGVDRHRRGLPYEARRGNAIVLWDPESAYQPENWARRRMKRLINEVETQLLLADRLEATELLRLRATDIHSAPDRYFERLEFSAETWLNEFGRADYTDWSYVDLPLRDGQQERHIYSKADARVIVEPLDSSIEIIGFCGVDNYGYQSWLVRHSESVHAGEEISWRYRRRFLPPYTAEPDSWLALTTSHAHYIKFGRFVVNFHPARPVRRAGKFATPKGTLPTLRGPTEELRLINQGSVVGADFKRLTPWHSHGIYWWLAEPDHVPGST